MSGLSNQLRQEGNLLYKNGKLSLASAKYQAASDARKDDPLPLSNLSAFLFEIGQYPECIESATSALQLDSEQ